MSRDSREEILRRIRTGLYRSTDLHQPKEIMRQSTDIAAELKVEKSILINQFVEELTKVSGSARILEGEDSVRDFIIAFVEEHGLGSFAIWESDLLEKLHIRDGLESKGLKLAHSNKKEEMAKADIGITEADFGIANSGTVVLIADEKQPRTVSLIPPIHIAILKSDKIVGNINDFFARIINLFVGIESVDNITSCMTFITGPSRTADIELNLTLGVHGPKEIFVLVLD